MPSAGNSLGRRRGSSSGWEGSAASRRCPGSKCETPRSEWSLEGREKGLATFSTLQVSQLNQRQCDFLTMRYVGILKSWRTQKAQFSIPDEFGHLTLGDSLISSMCHGLYAILSYTLARIHTWTVTKDILRDECRAKCCRQNSCSPNMFKPTILLQLGFYVGWSCVLTLMERARYIFIYSSHYHAHKSIHIFMTRYLVLKLTNATSLCGIDLSSPDDIR